ncbi:hypothetical protein AB0J86_37845 [Micromonospora sp. NPDC049559]|uniref:hypothetical protein n=1 Tax=Micromonospora sp. NPDC049559 TaxID=3155923 RepID=UPI0034289252
MKRIRGQRSLLMVGLGVIVAAVAASALAAQAKPATTATKSSATNQSASETAAKNASSLHRKKFNVSKTVYANDPKVKTCVRITLYGTLEYEKSKRSTLKGSTWTVYSGRKVVNPTMTVSSFSGPKCQGARKSVKLNRADLSQRWYTSNCTFNPGISVGFPWAVAVAPTVNCNQVTVAQNVTQHLNKAASYRQSNSNKEIKFDGAEYNNACLTVDASVKVYKKNAADSADTTFKVCPS